MGGSINPGLGTLNRLYIATELLNLHRGNWDGVKLALIEELEAHLHPQAQMRVIEKLEQICEAGNDVQFILTTHSPNLASKLKLGDLILCQGNKAYPMGSDYTELEERNYVFLEKFLDVTKANLFFARGVIFGVSIVNVGGVQFLHYSKIFQRKNDGDEIDVPVSIVTDCDVHEYEEIEGGGDV